MSRRRTGKVARLPKELRDQIDTLLLDGVRYKDIIQQFAASGIALKPKHLITWRKGGHQDSLKEQQRLDDMRAIRDFSLKAVASTDGQVHQANLELAASQMYELLNEFNPNCLRDKLNDDPQFYTRIVGTIARLSEGGLKYTRYRAEVAKCKQQLEKEVNAAKSAGLTPEVLANIQQALNLL